MWWKKTKTRKRNREGDSEKNREGEEKGTIRKWVSDRKKERNILQKSKKKSKNKEGKKDKKWERKTFKCTL